MRYLFLFQAYDKYIDQVRTEITDNVELQERNSVQPQIKKPSQGQKKSPPSIPRIQTDKRARIDSDGSRSTSSLDSPVHTTPLSPITPGMSNIKLSVIFIKKNT